MQGVFSDLFVVKGVGIGHEVVSVLSLEPDLRQMADRITLTVAEAMSVEPPSPVIVLIGAIIKYRLKVIRGSSPQGFLFSLGNSGALDLILQACYLIHIVQ